MLPAYRPAHPFLIMQPCPPVPPQAYGFPVPPQACGPVPFPPLARYFGAAQSGAASPPPPPPPPPLQACCLAWSTSVHQPGSAWQRLVGSNLAEEKREEEREEERNEVGEEVREAEDRCSPSRPPAIPRAHARTHVCGSHYSVDEHRRVQRRIRVNEPGLTT